MNSLRSNSRPKWAIERPTGIWLITVCLGFTCAFLPLFGVLMSFIRYKRGVDANFNLEEGTAIVAGTLIVFVICLGAWLGSKWYRYPLALLVVWNGCFSVYEDLLRASAGKIDAKGSMLELKIPFIIIISILAVCYLHADSDVKRFFTPYPRKSSSPKSQQTS